MASLNEFTQTLGKDHAAHLLRRCTFGPDIDQINFFASLTPAQAVDQLFSEEDTPLPPIDPVSSESWVNPPVKNKADAGREQSTLIEYFKTWHLDVMRKSGNIKEKIIWFYHSHLPVSKNVVESSEAIYYQNCLFRFYAYGSFKELFKKICVDNAMLRYIDGYINRKNEPNENFAREMLELYSIGKGPQIAEGNYTNYTEDDVRAATRVLTGWTVDWDFENIDSDTNLPTGIIVSSTSGTPDKYIATLHDGGDKTFSDIFNNMVISSPELIDNKPTTEGTTQELGNMIDMIFDKTETAHFLIRKLYRFFIYHIITEEVETDIIQPLAQTLYNQNYNISETLKVLFKSEHFYDADNTQIEDNIAGALIKTPIEVTIGLLRFFNVSIPDRETETSQFYTDMGYLVSRLHEQGLDYYEPYDVAGYDPYHQMPGYNRNWITTYALARRYQIGEIMMKRSGPTDEYSFQLDILNWVKNSGHIADPSDASQIADAFINHLFAVKVNEDRYNYFLNTVFLDTFNPTIWQYEWNNYIAFNDDSVVRERIEILLSALIQTPEFQLC